MSIKIDKDMPIPEATRSVGSGRKSKYPFDKMEPRDSFLMPQGTKPNTAVHLIYYWQKKFKHKRKFIFREIDGRIRIWRSE